MNSDFTTKTATILVWEELSNCEIEWLATVKEGEIIGVTAASYRDDECMMTEEFEPEDIDDEHRRAFEDAAGTNYDWEERR